MKQTDNNDTSHYEGAILENIQDKIDLILEILGVLQPMQSDIRQLKDDVHVLKQDVGVIKKVVTSQSKQLNNHERRITKLEVAV